MSAVDPNLLAAFGPTIEPWMWGIVSAVFLSGVVIAQAYTYFTSEEEDSPWLKSYVGFLIILSLVEGVCDVVILHFRLIMHFGNYLRSMYGTGTQDFIVLFIRPVISASCQGFFAHRSYKSTKNIWVAIVLAAGVLGTLSSGFASGAIVCVYFKTLSASVRVKLDITVQVYNWLSAMVDVMISLVFLYSMFKLGKSEYAGTDSVLRKLMIMSFQTASLTTIFALCAAIVSKAQGPSGNWVTFFASFNSRIFVITVLYILNSRPQIRARLDGTPSTHGGKSFGRKSKAGEGAGQIEVTLQTFTRTEAAADDEGKWTAQGHSTKGGVTFAN